MIGIWNYGNLPPASSSWRARPFPIKKGPTGQNHRQRQGPPSTNTSARRPRIMVGCASPLVLTANYPRFFRFQGFHVPTGVGRSGQAGAGWRPRPSRRAPRLNRPTTRLLKPVPLKHARVSLYPRCAPRVFERKKGRAARRAAPAAIISAAITLADTNRGAALAPLLFLALSYNRGLDPRTLPSHAPEVCAPPFVDGGHRA